MTISTISSGTSDLLATRLGMSVQHRSWSVLLKIWITALKVKVTAKFKMLVNVCPDDIFWITEHFVTKFGMAIQHHEPECQAEEEKIVAIIFKVKITARAHMMKMWLSLYYSFWTVDSLATKLGLMIHHHKPECPVEKKSLLFSRSRPQQRVKMLQFVQMISSKPPNILFSNLVLWCIIMSQSVMQKDWFAIFKVKVTASAHVTKIWQLLLYLLNCWSFCYQTWFDSTLS